MGNVFIAWNNLDLAKLVAETLSREFSDKFLVGAQTPEINHFGMAAFSELDVCDQAIVLITPSSKHVVDRGEILQFFSPNQFLELGYALGRMAAENVLIFLIGIDPAKLPSDIVGTRVIPLPAADPDQIATMVARAYRERVTGFTRVSELAVFNEWPRHRTLLTEVARAPGSLAHTAEIARVVLHSIQPAFYYQQIESLEQEVNAMHPTGVLADVAGVLATALRHYRSAAGGVKAPFNDLLDDFTYTGPDPWIGIIGRDFAALRHMQHARSLDAAEDTDSARYFAERAGAILDKAIDGLGRLPQDLYVNLWRGYLYLNRSSVHRFLHPKDPGVRTWYEAAIKVRGETIQDYARSFYSGQPNLILSCLEQEYDLAQIRYFAYCRNDLGIEPERLDYHVRRIRARLEAIKRRNELWTRVEAELAAFEP